MTALPLARFSALRFSALVLLTGVAGLSGGCTFEDGASFASLDAQLSARYQLLPDRMVDARFQRLASGYELALDRAELQIAGVELHAATTGSGAFDPARPPAGYSLCHNGHCHADDGRLVPYAEIEATLAASEGSKNAPVLGLGGGAFDLLSAGAPVPLPCPAGCALGYGRVISARLAARSARLELAVRAGPGAPRPLAETTIPLELASGAAPDAGTGIAPPSWTAALDLPADNRHPPRVSLTLTLQLSAAAFDRLDWATLAETPGSDATRRAIAEALGRATIDVLLERSDRD